jgi:uncharacterized membrane protein YobD (UPF0266 family)
VSYIVTGIIIVLIVGTLIGEPGMAVLIGLAGLVLLFFISNVKHTSSLFGKKRK